MKRVVHGLARVSAYATLGSLFILMFLISGDVIGRYCFSRPIKGTEDISEILMIIAVFFGFALTQVVKGHVTVEFVTSRLSRRYQAILNCFTSIVSAALFALMTWQLGKRAWALLIGTTQGTTSSLGLPLGPFVLIAAIGCALLFLVLLTDFSDSLAQAIKQTTSQTPQDNPGGEVKQ